MIKVNKGDHFVTKKKLENFTSMQGKFWDAAFMDSTSDALIALSDIYNKRFDPFRDNLWYGELIFDSQGTFCDLEMIFTGKTLADYYGQRRGQHMLTNYSNNSFRTDFPTYHYRFKNLLEIFLKEKAPLLSISNYSESNSKNITVEGLMLPATRSGKEMDAIIGLTELTIR